MNQSSKAKRIKFAFGIVTIGCAFAIGKALPGVSVWVWAVAVGAWILAGHAIIDRYFK